MYLSFAALGVNVPVTVLLVPEYGIVGIIIGSLMAGLASTLLALFVARSKYSLRPELGYAFSLLIPSLLSAAATTLVNADVSGAPSEFALGSLVFMICFAFTLPIFARREDLWKMKNLFAVVGKVGQIASKIFDVELRLSDLFNSVGF
jgi:peptidoglycan biosynthesis protein MviN/MurJ (putative lipid II flippase)